MLAQGSGWVCHLLGRKLSAGAWFPCHGARVMWGLVIRSSAPVPVPPPLACRELALLVRALQQDPEVTLQRAGRQWLIPPGKRSASPRLPVPIEPGPRGGHQPGLTHLVPEADSLAAEHPPECAWLECRLSFVWGFFASVPQILI